MRRLKYLFAGLFLLFTLPIWRLLDWAYVTLPFQVLLTSCLVLWALCLVAFPLKLIFPSLKRWQLLMVPLLIGALSWVSGTSTSLTTLEPDLNHCSRSSYTGFFYPARKLFSNAHIDDLEVRNQMCWIVKMVSKVPSKIEPSELANHLNLTKNKLMKPAHKYRASLPWITFLLGKYLTSSDIQNSTLLVQNLAFWADLYTEEISARKYHWYDWPHSKVIKLEYGIIENNWENIHIQFSN
jgi:hypothetical protein